MTHPRTWAREARASYHARNDAPKTPHDCPWVGSDLLHVGGWEETLVPARVGAKEPAALLLLLNQQLACAERDHARVRRRVVANRPHPLPGGRRGRRRRSRLRRCPRWRRGWRARSPSRHHASRRWRRSRPSTHSAKRHWRRARSPRRRTAWWWGSDGRGGCARRRVRGGGRRWDRVLAVGGGRGPRQWHPPRGRRVSGRGGVTGRGRVTIGTRGSVYGASGGEGLGGRGSGGRLLWQVRGEALGHHRLS
mmetsp:Transcript_43034/g.86245  ORF Transcript_43034/g.86245 Transcript_43034/m.86245 type:complete len:250 (-) Transcript_43034:1288-2037(-)